MIEYFLLTSTTALQTYQYIVSHDTTTGKWFYVWLKDIGRLGDGDQHIPKLWPDATYTPIDKDELFLYLL